MRPWTDSKEAAALLASCAAVPPPRRLFVYRFQDIEFRFVGRRVQRLRRLYRRSEPPVDDPQWRAWLALDPQRAVARAVSGRATFTPPLSGDLRCTPGAETHCAATTA